MKRPVTKIICAALSSVVALSVAAAAGCSGTYSSKPLEGGLGSSAEVISNGGFAVQKGDYIYFINGVEANTADNTFGKPLKGTVQRISVDNLKAANYSSTETVVPQIVYTTAYNAGLFIYGDYIYYPTPSTARNSDGTVLNSELELKRTKLDGTETPKEGFAKFTSAATDYRFVLSGDVVYLLYVAESETLYEESTGVTNLHSVNTETGEDVLLAYNISSYVFDAEDKSNPRVYYTMNVTNYAGTSNSSYPYNQIYTVTADVTKANEYDTSSIIGWDEESDRYINCGTLVFDGIGGKNTVKTPFNHNPSDAADVNDLGFTYTLETYRHNTLFYTRHTSNNSSEYLFSLKDGAMGAEWSPIKSNPAQDSDSRILTDGSSADSYMYMFDGDKLTGIITTANGGISVNYADASGKLSDKMDEQSRDSYYKLVGDGTATLLFTDGDYLYYSLSGGTGYTFYRINYKGTADKYEGMPETDDVSDYSPIKILDLDAANDWFMPEALSGHLLFASKTDNMANYTYIMTYDIAGKSNADISAVNELYDSVKGDDGLISDFGDTSKYPNATYANLSSAMEYLFYTSDREYIDELAAAHTDAQKKAEEAAKKEGTDYSAPDPVYSDSTLKKLDEFMTPADGNDWKDFSSTKKVNGEDVYANRRDYYYSVLGRMTEEDAENLRADFRAGNLQAWPEETEVTWWAGLNKPAKVFFIIGMCAAGLLVLGGITLVVLAAVRKKRSEKLPVYRKRRVKVDTTDDKNINVYEDEPTDGNKTE